jgi:hypothetical protein
LPLGDFTDFAPATGKANVRKLSATAQNLDINPRLAVEPPPQGDTGTVVGLPHDGEMLLEVPFLVGIVRVANNVFI